MLTGDARPGLSSIAAVLVVVVVVVGAVGAFYLVGQSPQGGTSSSQSTNPTQTSESSSTTGTTSTSTAGGTVILILGATPVLASSTIEANYSVSVEALGSVPPTLNLTASSPPGIQIGFVPTFASTDPNAPKSYVTLKVSNSTSPGDYSFNVTAAYAGATYTFSEDVEVVKYLVVTVGAEYLPQHLTVPVGSEVYWMRLNGRLSQYDSGAHNIAFYGSSVISPTLDQYQSWSYTFSAAGDYKYYCTFHPFQKGEVVVTQ